MLLQRHTSRICRKKHNAQAQRVFKTAPLYAVTNPEPTATPELLALFTTFFESLWAPSTNPDGSTVQKAGMSYVYDEDGTLIAQTLTGGAQTSWGQSARYIYLPTASGPMPVAAIYGTKHYAIQSDYLNTPRRLIQSDGQVAWQWAYSAFGEEKPTIAKTRFVNPDLNQSFGMTGVPAVTFNLRYPGQYFDQETGLHYNYHRSYSAATGRYTQADPIGLAGGWNRYGYAESNSVSFTDPSGLVTWKGWARSIGIGPFQREEYILTSDCACGLEIKVLINVYYGGKGVGAIAQKWYANLTDANKCPDANVFMGPAYSYSAAAAAKWGFGYSRTRIGGAESAGWDVIQGLGAGVGVATGFPEVEVLSVRKCDDCNK